MARKNGRSLDVLTERWEDLQVAWKLLMDKQVDFSLKLIPIFALLYLLSPIDLIPDLLLGPGQLDDVGIVLVALAMFLRLAPPQRVAQARRDLGQDDVEVEITHWDEDR